MRGSSEQVGQPARHARRPRSIGRGAIGLVLLLLAPLLVTVAGPASPAAAATGPSPIPADLWDADPGLPTTQSWVVIDGSPGDQLTDGSDTTYTSAVSDISAAFSDTGSRSALRETSLGRPVRADDPARPSHGGLLPGPEGVGSVRHEQGRNALVLRPHLMCRQRPLQPGRMVRRRPDRRRFAGLTSLTLRFGQTCEGGPDSREDPLDRIGSDTPALPQRPVPDDLWDTNRLSGPIRATWPSTLADPVLDGADRLYTKANSQLTLSVVDRTTRWT